MSAYRYKKYKPKRKPKKRIFRKGNLFFKSRFFWDFVLGLILFLAVIYLIFFSPLFKIKEISVSAPDLFLQKEAGEAALKKMGANIFFVSDGKIERTLAESFSQIEKVEVFRRLPGTLALKIEKKKPAVLWCRAGDDCLLADKNGAFFKDGEFKNPEILPLVILSGADWRESEAEEIKEIIAKIIKINQALINNIKIESENFILEEENGLKVKTEEGWFVYFDIFSEIEAALAKLKMLLEKELPLEQRKNLNYIDLRFSKIYYK